MNDIAMYEELLRRAQEGVGIPHGDNEFNRALAHFLEEYGRMVTRNKEMEAALRFYAEMGEDYNGGGEHEFYEDKGERARKALEGG